MALAPSDAWLMTSWPVRLVLWRLELSAFIHTFSSTARVYVYFYHSSHSASGCNENHRVSWMEAGNHRKSVVDVNDVRCKNESIKDIERRKPYQRSEPIFAFDRCESYLLLLCFLLCLHSFSLPLSPPPPIHPGSSRSPPHPPTPPTHTLFLI